MANFLQIGMDGYINPSVLKHMGVALTAIAADMEKEYRYEPKDRTVCQGPTLAPPPVTPEAPSVLGMTVGVDQTLPPEVLQMTSETQTVTAVNVAPPAPPHVEAIDDDDSWADPPGGTPTAGDLDSAGFPWDARIHAGSKAKMKADGTWKLKPGVDKALVEQVRAEIGGTTIPHNPALAEAIRPDVPVPPPPAPTLTDAVAVSAELQAPPAPPEWSTPLNFAELIQEVTKRITAGSLTADQVNGAVALATGGQLTMCNQLAARQDLIPAVWAVLVPA